MTRTILEGELDQGTRERIAYRCTIPDSWGTVSSLSGFVAYDLTDNNEVVTSSILSGSGSAAGNVITSPFVYNLTTNHRYEIHGTFTTTAGNTLDFVIPIRATR